MKLELEWPEDEMKFKHLFSPSHVGGPAYHGVPEDQRDYVVYATSVKSPSYFGATGIGKTPQAAADHALAQIREYVAKRNEPVYTTPIEIDLDLSFI